MVPQPSWGGNRRFSSSKRTIKSPSETPDVGRPRLCGGYRPAMGQLSLRRPQGRDAAAALVFAVLYFVVIWFAIGHGWQPQGDNLHKYRLAGICVVAVLLARESWPSMTLLATVVIYP